MLPSPRRLAASLATAAVLALAACGSGGNASNGGVGAGGHDSAENAVRGFINALAGFDGSADSTTKLLDWITPSARSEVSQAISFFSTSNGGSLKFYFSNVNVGSASVAADGNHASVPVGGSLCISASESGSSTSTCPTNQEPLTATRDGGQWYVDGSVFTGSGGSESSSSGSSSESTGAGSQSSSST